MIISSRAIALRPTSLQMLLACFCCVVLAAYLLLWVRMRRPRALLAGLPTFPQLPFIGNMWNFLGGGKYVIRLLNQIAMISEEKMKPFVFWVGPCPFLVSHDPDDVRMIVNTLIEKPYIYNFGKEWLGDGVVTAPASLWKKNVKKLAGIFSTTVVEGYQEVFNVQAQKLVDNLKTKAGEPFDAMHYLAHTTLEAICHTALGVAHISKSVSTEQYYHAFNRTMELIIARGLNILLHLDCFYRLTPGCREMESCIAVIHTLSDTVLKQKKLERENIKKNGVNERETCVEFRSVLDILLDISESDSQFTEQQIKSEVDTIILGGQETVASTLFFTTLMLGCRPGVQKKLYEELVGIYGASKRPVVKEDLARMEYCEAVINETLRLFPPFPVVARYADKEVQLKSCMIPKGSVCAINIWGAGRSRKAWGPDASEFKPERWLKGELSSSAATFLAFSYGRRSCIGKRYAMAILKTVLAYCVRDLEFSSEADKMELKMDIALRAISGHLIKVKLRD